MCPLSDDALLDWALFPGEAKAELVAHLESCPVCAERSRKILREQQQLRESFTGLAAPSRPSARAPWTRIAALLFVALSVGVLVAWTLRHPGPGRASSTRAHRTPRLQADLSRMAQKVAEARHSLHKGEEDPRAAFAYLDLVSQEEELYLEGMEQYLSEESPLSDEQKEHLRRMLREYYSAISGQERPAEASQDFLAQIRTLLNEEQYEAFEEFSRRGNDWQWQTAISLLVRDLGLELDLRYSEAERVRRALESNYPRQDSPVLRGDRCPSDPLVENALLSGAIRNSLDASYVGKYDSYLRHVRVARERVTKAARLRSGPN